MEASHITSNARSGKLGTVNKDDLIPCLSSTLCEVYEYFVFFTAGRRLSTEKSLRILNKEDIVKL